MKTHTVLQNYRNEEETEKCTDIATIQVKYKGLNTVLRPVGQLNPVTVECYFSVTDDVWYARIPATAKTPASDWVRTNPDNLIGLVEA